MAALREKLSDAEIESFASEGAQLPEDQVNISVPERKREMADSKLPEFLSFMQDVPRMTPDKVKAWFDRGKEMGATHLVIMMDRVDGASYPLYVKPGDSRPTKEQNLQKPTEVFDLRQDFRAQFHRHYPHAKV